MNDRGAAVTAPEPLTHSVDIDLVGVAKLKSVSPEPSDQGVINGETAIFRFRVQDGERITLDMGRRQVEVVVNPRAGAPYPGLGPAEEPVPRDEAAELRAAVKLYLARLDDYEADQYPRGSIARLKMTKALEALRAALAAFEGQP